MDTVPRTDKSSQAFVDYESPDRSSGKSIASAPAVPEDTNSSDPAQPAQTQVFTLFRRLPAELRVLIWMFACAPPGPRVHFLEPIADTNRGRVIFWHTSRRQWRSYGGRNTMRTPRVHWDISERTKDPCFQWSGRELLYVCIEARRVFLDQRTTALTGPREQTRVEPLDMLRNTDIVCIRAGVIVSGYERLPLNLEGDRMTGFCDHEKCPSPRRLALEVPAVTYRTFLSGWGGYLVPHWLSHYGRQQKFMQFERLEEVYILDQDIKPRAQEHHDSMPSHMYIEAFDGHHGSRFVAIDPKDDQAVRSWIIPGRCWIILRSERHFPYIYCSAEDIGYNQRSGDRSRPRPRLRFLACVKGSSQTKHNDDESLNSGLPLT